MKVLTISALIVGIPAAGLAGDYHNTATGIVCADCHIMHYSQTHDYGPGPHPTPIVGVTGPYQYLLRNDINDLCLTCHDQTTFAPDVLGPKLSGSHNRQAGALNRLGLVGLPATGHTLDDQSTVAPGGTWLNPNGLNCIDCHHQHGYNPEGNSYRNLRHNPGFYGGPALIVTYAVGANDPSKDVWETAAASYDVSNIWFNEPDISESAYGNWCKGCHTLFHGQAGDGNMGGGAGVEWLRHPTAGADIGAVGGGHSSQDRWKFGGGTKTNWVKVMSASGDWDGLAGSEDQTPSCMTCHKAHGNNNAFGLIYMSGSGPVTEEGDRAGLGTVEMLCGQCHIQTDAGDEDLVTGIPD